MQGADPPAVPPLNPQDRRATERELLAQLNLEHLRALKLASLRWFAATSVPAWLEAQWRILPDLLVWLAIVVQGFCLAMAIVYGALEYRWARRAAQLEPAWLGTVIHTTWTVWDELRSALWYGMAVVSLVPWIYLGVGRPLPTLLLSALTATAAAVLLLVVVAETAAQLRPLQRAHGGAGGSGAAPLTWLGRGRPAE